MPSAALVRWQADRMSRLGQTEAHCVALFAGAATAPSLLAQESLQAYVMLVSGHFQGFCRDLYSECSQIFAATLPAGVRQAVQSQFTAEMKLNTANPTTQTIRKDFERFGFYLDFEAVDPANALKMTHLGHLNYWRNAAAHQIATPAPSGIPAVLTLADVQVWRMSCDGLAASLDNIMRSEMLRILGTPPW